MAAPPKPWERQRGVNQRQPNFNPDHANSFVSVSPHMVPGAGGGGGLFPNSRPPLPPRPTNTSTYNTYSRPTYGTYGAYGALSTMGPGSYYGGGYGGGFGSYGNYNRFAVMGGPTPDDGFIRLAEDSSRQAFQSIESIVHAFGSVSMMLESTYHAVYSSFRAVLGVAEHFSRMKSHFAQIFSALAVVRTLRWLYRKLLYLIGLRSQDPNLEAAWRSAGASSQPASATITEADIKASKSSWPIVMFLAVVFGGPYLIWRLLSSLAPAVAKSHSWMQGQGEHYAAVAQYTFEAGSRNELEFRGGQSLFLAPKDQQPNVRGWLLASNGSKCGLVPANYIKILGLHSGLSHPVKAQLEQQGSSSTLDPSSRVVASRIPNMPTPKFAQVPHVVDSSSMPTDHEVKSSSQSNDQHPRNIFSGGQVDKHSNPIASQLPGHEVLPVMPEEREGYIHNQSLAPLNREAQIHAHLEAFKDVDDGNTQSDLEA